MALTSMKMDPKDAKAMVEPVAGDVPQYPYGLMLDLDDKAMKRLGIADLPPIGTVMMMMASVTVTRTSAHETQDRDKEACIGLQVTDMSLTAPQTNEAMAKRLYG